MHPDLFADTRQQTPLTIPRYVGGGRWTRREETSEGQSESGYLDGHRQTKYDRVGIPFPPYEGIPLFASPRSPIAMNRIPSLRSAE